MKKSIHGLISVLLFAVILGATLVFLSMFLPQFQLFRYFDGTRPVEAASVAVQQEEVHALALSEQALRNIGITPESIREITVSEYDKTISFPAILTGRPGRSTFRIPAPFAGIVRQVYVEPGMVVRPGQALFEITLTHEELIRCQSDLIALCQKRDTVDRELQRLESLTSEIAPKAKREAAIQKEEIDAQIETQRSILQVHGISEKEIRETIEGKRELVRSIMISVPGADTRTDEIEHDHPVIQMEELFVDKGQLVDAGAPLCQLVDLSLLYIEGRASSNDENILATALMEHCHVTALFDGQRVENLNIRYIDTRIDPVTRALRFFVELPNNVIVQDDEHSHNHPWRSADGQTCEQHRHYINWRFRPGQRCELKVEYDTISNCIVLPREAVAESGGEAFVFQWTGNEPDGDRRKVWLRKPVHVLHRSKSQIALANDGSIFPGTKVAARGANQLLVALGSGSGELQSTCPCGDH